MNTITLKEILLTGDMGEKGADKICDSVMDNTFMPDNDVVSNVIIQAFINNDYTDYDGMISDLSYAIQQLTLAKKRLCEIS